MNNGPPPLPGDRAGLGGRRAARRWGPACGEGGPSRVRHQHLAPLGNVRARAEPTRDLLRALGPAGWVEGRNLIFERRSAGGRFRALGDILRELVGLPCDVVVTTGPAMTAEALRVTSTVPIVFPAVDPITAGLVTALGRRDRNITGMMGTGPQLEGKRLEVLPEALPKTRRVAVLEQPSS